MLSAPGPRPGWVWFGRLTPAAEVTSVVHSDWDRWRDPGTGTDALLAEVGLPPAGPFDQVVSRDPGSC